MIALLQAVLPSLDFREVWSLSRPAKGFDRGFAETAIVGSRIFYIESTGRNRGDYGCLDAATGRKLWSRPTALDTTHYLDATPRYLAISEERSIRIYDPKDGRPIWSAPREGFGAGPLILGDLLVAERRQNVLSAFSLKDRRVVWSKTFPARVQTKTGFDRMKSIGADLWIADELGRVSRLRAADGKTLWTRPFEGGEVANFASTKAGVAVFGNQAVELWRSADGRPVWRESAIAGWSGGSYHAPSNELWIVHSDGRLYRFDAATGRRNGDSPAREAGTEGTFEPIPYLDGLMVLGSGPMVRLDASGRQIGRFDPQEGIHELRPIGADLLLNSGDRLVLLRPGRLATSVSAEQLVAKPVLTPQDRRTLLAMGRWAVLNLFVVIPKAKGDRLEALARLLTALADARDTARIFDLADRNGLFAKGEGYPPLYGAWLMEKADPDVVALRLLPRLKAATDERQRWTLLTFSVRSTAKPVVDELYARLESPKTPDAEKGLIYSSIAASGRADVLDEVLRLRSGGRRLERPIAALSPTRDGDGDGLTDAIDANPFVAPRNLNETERILLAAFDARFRFDERTNRLGRISYGKGVVPFELVGWRGGLVPEERADALGFKQPTPSPDYPYPFVRFQSQRAEGAVVALNPQKTEATVEVGVTYGGLDGTGYRITLRKMRGEWFAVSMRMTWIS